MRNDTTDEDTAEPKLHPGTGGVGADAPARLSTLVILASDDDAICVDDLCLPTELAE